MNVNDEILGALLDGELTGAKRAEAEAAIAADPGAARRLARMRVGDELVRSAVPLAQARGDDPLAQRILAAKPAWTGAVSRGAQRFAALAAACVMGVLAGRFLGPQPGADWTIAPSALARVLEATPSGEAVSFGGDAAYVETSFITSGGALCRKFEARVGGAPAEAIACRNGGDWHIVAQAITVQAGDGYRTAGASDHPIEHFMASLGAVQMLDAESEAEMIASHWRRAHGDAALAH